MNKNERLGKSKVIERLLELEWHVYLDVLGYSPVDLFAWKEGRSVSLKVLSAHNGIFNTQNLVEVDYVCLYMLDEDMVFFIPFAEIVDYYVISGNEADEI